MSSWNTQRGFFRLGSRLGMPSSPFSKAQALLSYFFLAASKPANRPSLKEYFSPTMKAALVYSATYSLKYRLLSRMYLTMPPMKAMSVPERSGTWKVLRAEVLENLGST